ncbi:MAG TPA: hypothetical protein VFU36_18820 [Jatrophihabitans sp.]|nr:hypothetical protein [Jatrophihabitans sp.]
MADVAGSLSLRPLREADLTAMFEIQLDEDAQHLAAFVDRTAQDRAAYLEKRRKILMNAAITTRVIEFDGDIVGSVGSRATPNHRHRVDLPAVRLTTPPTVTTGIRSRSR